MQNDDTPHVFTEMPETAAPPLRSAAERNGFPDWLVTYGWILVAFILFQVVAGVVIIIGAIITPGMEMEQMLTPSGLMNNIGLMFAGNSLGQVVAFGILTIPVIYFVRRGSISEFLPFRITPEVWKATALASVFVLVSQPAVWLLAWLNALVPMPEFMQEMEQQQTALIESFLKSDFNLLLALVHVALVPAICEEILYRGFVMNMLRRTKPVWTAILISGIIFGLYHLRLNQVVPLALIGIFLGWITVRTGSLLPAMAAHFVNNGFSVLVVRLMPDSDLASTDPSMPPVWAAALSVVAAYGILYLFKQVTQNEGEDHVQRQTE